MVQLLTKENKMKTIEEQIAIMQSYSAGGIVQQKGLKTGLIWSDVAVPTWNWTKYDYKMKANPYHEVRDTAREVEVPYITLTFGKVPNSNNPDRDVITFDSYFRNGLLRHLGYDDLTRYMLIPINDESKELLDIIVEEKKQRVDNDSRQD